MTDGSPAIENRGLRRFAADALSAAVLILLNLILYRKVVLLWWTYDDANILRMNFDYRWLAEFTNVNVWPQQLFTPLLMSAFRAQLALFGLEPRSWYALHLGLAIATMLAVYAAVRQFLEPNAALSSVAIFAAGAPLCSVVTQLSTVHYFIAILCSALATIAYVVAVRRGNALAAMASIVFYFAAMLAKEVAIPLPLLLIALPLRDFRTRIRYLVGHGAAAILYFLWRHAVLGTFLGAYGWRIKVSEWPGLLLHLPWRVIRAAAGSGLTSGLMLLILMALVIVLGMRRRWMWLGIAAAVVALAPLMPLAKEVNRRYVVVPWLAWSVAFAALAAQRKPRAAAVLLGVVPLLTIAVNRQEWRDEFALRRRMSDEAHFFFDMPPNGLMRLPAPPPAVMGELNWLKTVHLGLPSGASWFYDDIFLCSNGAAGKRVWEYDRSRRAVVEITSKIFEIGARHCRSIRANEALTVAFHYRKPALEWDLGPYTDGKYSAVIGNGIQAFELPRHDALSLPGLNGIGLRIRYESPRGWTTYSPEFALDFVRQPDVTWKR